MNRRCPDRCRSASEVRRRIRSRSGHSPAARAATPAESRVAAAGARLPEVTSSSAAAARRDRCSSHRSRRSEDFRLRQSETTSPSLGRSSVDCRLRRQTSSAVPGTGGSSRRVPETVDGRRLVTRRRSDSVPSSGRG